MQDHSFSTKTRKLLGNPSLTAKRFHWTFKISLRLRSQEIRGSPHNFSFAEIVKIPKKVKEEQNIELSAMQREMSSFFNQSRLNQLRQSCRKVFPSQKQLLQRSGWEFGESFCTEKAWKRLRLNSYNHQVQLSWLRLSLLSFMSSFAEERPFS